MAANFKMLIFITFLAAALAMLLVVTTIPVALIKFILTLIALLLATVAFAMRYYSYIVLQFMHPQKKNIILKDYEPFIVSPSGNSIIIREGSDVYATSFVKIPVYVSATEMADEDKINISQLFARLLATSTAPMRVSSQLYVVNKDLYLNNIRDKLNDAERRYHAITTAKDAQPSAVERIKGEVTMWHNLLDNIGKSQSFALSSFITVSSYGGNEEEASNLAVQKATEIAASVSALFGVVAEIVQMPEILSLVEPEYLIPISTVSEQIRQKNISEAI